VALTDVAVMSLAQGSFAEPGRHSHTVDDEPGPAVRAPELEALGLEEGVAARLALAVHAVADPTSPTATTAVTTAPIGRDLLRHLRPSMPDHNHQQLRREPLPPPIPTGTLAMIYGGRLGISWPWRLAQITWQTRPWLVTMAREPALRNSWPQLLPERSFPRLDHGMALTQWFLSAGDRGNSATTLDGRRGDGLSWSEGNDVQALIHGSEYFARLSAEVRGLEAGDLLLFTDWRGDPDEIIDRSTGTRVSALFADAARRGVTVKGLVWRSHWDRLAFSASENRHLGQDIEAAGGQCLLDMRVRRGGSHHQKFVVLRHQGEPSRDVAFIGGIDLCHSRHDDRDHGGDGQRQPMAAVYGPRPPWHDVQLQIRGPAVADAETVFRERWTDPSPLMRNPIYRAGELIRREDHHPLPLPGPWPDPPAAGSCMVQLLRTYGYRRHGYPFAPEGERSIARGYQRVIERATRLIYVEDQYFWSADVVRCFAEALTANRELRLILVIPHYPDQDGKLSKPPTLVGRQAALNEVYAAGGDRVGVYGIENPDGVPVYVHAKVCVADDVWASTGSDNVNRRSWTHDSELTCAVLDTQPDPREPTNLDRFGDGARLFARGLRLRLAEEHLDRVDGDHDGLIDPVEMFDAFARSADQLQRWHDGGRTGPRPPGRLRPYSAPRLSRSTRAWAGLLYRTICDPDGRPSSLRRRGAY
jgi:phosphatidylserine/phosphatidylglycerophosphate/cardiolipin synthase-like enzyme